MSQFPNTKGQKTMAESDPVVLPSDQIINVASNGGYLGTEATLLSILSSVQQQTDYETKLIVDSLDVTYLEVRTWNSSTGSFNPPTYYLPNSNTPATPTPPLEYINPNTFLSLIVSNTIGLNLENTQQLVLSAVTSGSSLLNNINDKLVNGNDIGDVTINNGAGAASVNIQDGGNVISIDDAGSSITVDGTVNISTSGGPISISGTVGLDVATLSALESITIQNGGGGAAVNIQDGGNVISIDDAGSSITVDGTVSLDAATLSALENITIQNGSGAAAVNIQDGGNSITVDATDLDIRNLTFATDKVDVSNSVVGLDVTTLSALESITVQNGGGGAAVNIQDGGNSITVDGGTGFQRTPNFLRPSGVSGTISAGAYSVSISSVGTSDATVGGITLKPGETLNFEGGGINNTIGAITYDATTPGAELIIIKLT